MLSNSPLFLFHFLPLDEWYLESVVFVLLQDVLKFCNFGAYVGVGFVVGVGPCVAWI